MTESISFRTYGTQVLRESLQRMLVQAERVHAGEDCEALHAMRVASRRLRAAIGVFAAAYPDPAFRKFERDVKAVTDALGEARDLDVMLEALAGLLESLPENERAGVEALIRRKQRRRAALQQQVRRALDHLARRSLDRRLEEIASLFDRPLPASPWRPVESAEPLEPELPTAIEKDAV